MVRRGGQRLGGGDAEELLEDLERLRRVGLGDGVARDAWVRVDLEVVATLEVLVAEEVDLVVVRLREVVQAEPWFVCLLLLLCKVYCVFFFHPRKQ